MAVLNHNFGIRLATKTMLAIDAALEADQGNKFRHYLQQVLPHMEDIYRQDDEGDKFRSHLGASMLGRPCARELWYKFYWFHPKRVEAKMLRLFNRGHMEEARSIALLLMIGVNVWQHDENKKQFRISRFGGHVGGSGDGVALGVPDLEPGQYCNLEFKTHNLKSFTKLQEKGVREAKPDHYTQMQSYMSEMRIPICLYFATCKDSDELYLELVTLNQEYADQGFHRGETIVQMPRPPKRFNESPGAWQCRNCDERMGCHRMGGVKPDRNCRTCDQSRPLPDGTWACDRLRKILTKEDQLAACGEWSVRAT